jgi:S-adenosylmethionine hydrolase
MKHIIALLTDFGPKGQHYVAAMKAVILNINPGVEIIDISHSVSTYSIIEASYILKTTYKHFPKTTVFIVVVDPGVGSSRKIVALKTASNYFFIGPDNGIFPNTFVETEISDCISIQNEEYFLHPISPTFHGRDIMAPVGAHITKNKNAPLEDLGSKYDFTSLAKIPITLKLDLENRSIMSTIQYVDSFGNGTTTIPIIGNKLGDSNLILKDGSKISIFIEDNEYDGVFSSHFSSVPKDSIVILVGSTGFLEVSINQGNAANILDFKVGDIIKIRF